MECQNSNQTSVRKIWGLKNRLIAAKYEKFKK